MAATIVGIGTQATVQAVLAPTLLGGSALGIAFSYYLSACSAFLAQQIAEVSYSKLQEQSNRKQR